jgi:hypothetical protein
MTVNKTDIPTYLISTRNNITYYGVTGHGYGNYSYLDLKNLINTCPSNLAIVVHGWFLNESQVKERLDRVKMSFENDSYTNTSLVGFSWPSDIPWNDAKFIAKENGPMLADFISSMKNSCKDRFNKDVQINLIGHSLGARVILSALDTLYKDPNWNSGGFKIASVNLMGAAVDNEEVSKNPRDIIYDRTNWGSAKSDYGNAIEKEVVHFYNLYNTKDNTLGPNPVNPFYPYQVYPSFEGDLALGQNGSQVHPKIALPNNYVDINVTAKIPLNRDADGDTKCDDLRIINETNPFNKTCMITEAGDSHYGYFGFRDPIDNTKLNSTGAMDIVVSNLMNNTKS